MLEQLGAVGPLELSGSSHFPPSSGCHGRQQPPALSCCQAAFLLGFTELKGLGASAFALVWPSISAR